MIKLLIKIKSKLLKDALCKYIEKFEDFEIIKIIKSEKLHSYPDIIVTDLQELTEKLVTTYSKAKFFLIDTGINKEDILFNLIKFKLKGVFSSDCPSDFFIKALRVINQGQIWLSNTLVNSLINIEFIQESNIGKIKITEKEKQIIQYVCEGLSNKEIAKKVFISEQTVKAHLHKIFQKLGVKNRAQLIKLYIYNNR